MKLSICIASYNARAALERCLGSLAAHPPAAPHEILVVVDESGDGTADFVRQSHPGVILLTNPARVGMSASHNQAFRRARGEYALQLGADTQPRPGAIDALVAFLDREPSCGIAGAKLVNPDGSLQPTGRRFPTVGSKLASLWKHQRAHGQELFVEPGRDYARTEEVDEMCNACLLIRRAVFDRVGYLDESFFLYWDDVEFSYRVKQAGWRVFQVVEAEVVHEGGVSYSGAAPWAIVEGYRSELVFWGRHGSALQALAVRAINLAIFPPRVLAWLLRALAGRMDRATLAARLGAHGRGAWLNLTYAAPPPKVR